MIVFAGIVPHPPVLIPSIGKGEEKKVEKTHQAMMKFAEELSESDPDVIIFISPHMAHYPHMFTVCGMPDLYGSLRSFGDKTYEWHGYNDVELAAEIFDKSEDEGLTTLLYDNGEGEYEVDHGIMVPYYFLNQKLDYSHKLLPIGYSSASRSEHYVLGQIISRVCEKSDLRRVAIIASGDLSHRLGQRSQSGEFRGEEFDNKFMELIKNADEFSIVNMDDDLVEKAGECAYRSVLVLLGAITGREYTPQIYSYEHPFGIGYMVVNMGLKDQ